MSEAPPSPGRGALRFPRGCVASPHHLASAVGLTVLASGGNALDAAIATNLALSVVAPYLCGPGGDLFALVWDGGRLRGYNGSGRSGARATLEAVTAALVGRPAGSGGPSGAGGMPELGALPVTVPGAVEGWFALLEQFGSRPFAELAAPAIRLAAEGFPLSVRGAAAVQEAAAEIPHEGPAFGEWHRTYGSVGEGSRLRQPGLARTLETLAASGPDAYYRGPIAPDLIATVRAAGGLLEPEDLAGHRGEWVEPLRAGYRGVEVVELPPNTQGVAALEALGVVEALGPLPAAGPDREHRLVEAMKLALADRELVTDPAWMRVDPRTMAGADWARERARSVDPGRAGTPGPAAAGPPGTAFLCAADETGMLVSLIQSNYAGFGSGLTVPGWGINLHDRGAFFSLDPAHANAVAPEKRTMHTLIPAMALRDGRPWLVFGAMGGDGQAQTHVQLLVRIVDDGADLQQAIDAPRWFVEPGTWAVTAERRFAEDTIEGLRARGHEVAVTAPFDSLMGHAHAIAVESSGYAGATDPRAEGAVLGL